MKKLILLLLFAGFSVISAQTMDNLSSLQTQTAGSQYSDRPAQYILGGGDILLVNVNLWGHVQRPGIYSIPSSYSLIDLMSSAGGPLHTARLSDIRIVRKNQEIIQVNVEKFLKTGNPELLPILQPGDTIIVAGSIQDIFLRVVAVFRDLAIIANVIVLATRVYN
jgi:protein involved in polysaccharide export with SLBB domain